MIRWHDPQKSIALLLEARDCVLEGQELADAGVKDEAARKLREAERLRAKAKERLGVLYL